MASVCACGPTIPQAFVPPQIEANPISPGLFANAPHLLSANVIRGGGLYENLRIDVFINRDRDADPRRFSRTGARHFVIAPAPDAGNVVLNLPQTLRFEPAQLVTAEWVLSYHLANGGQDIAEVTSIKSVRQRCTRAQVDSFLENLERVVKNPGLFPQTLAGPADVAHLATLGFLPSHFFVSFPGMGVAFARLEALLPQELIDIAEGLGIPQFTFRPHLLLYAPPSGATTGQVSDPLGADYPYRLIGFAFAAPYDPGGPPEFGCLPREAWFVHEAGWHRADGGFKPQQVDEAHPGDENPMSPPWVFPPDPLDQVWHHRLWDVHLWLTPDDSGPTPPKVSMCRPTSSLAPADFFAATGRAMCNGPVSPEVGPMFPPSGFFLRALPR